MRVRMNVNMANTHPSEYVWEWDTRNRKVTMFDQTILIRFTRRDCGFDNVTDRQSEMEGYKKCNSVPSVGVQGWATLSISRGRIEQDSATTRRNARIREIGSSNEEQICKFLESTGVLYTDYWVWRFGELFSPGWRLANVVSRCD